MIKIKRHMTSSELSTSATNSDELIQDAAAALDNHNASEILGRVVFEGEDGKFYQMTVEAVIEEISRDHAEELSESE